MQNLIRFPIEPRSDAAPTCITSAAVTGQAGVWFFLEGAGPGLERAQRAASCLIEPGRGDTVLVCHDGTPSGAYILAVLTRAEPDHAALALPGGVSLRVDEGALTVQTRRLSLEASECAAIQAPSVVLSGVRGEARFQRLDAVAHDMRARFGAVHSVARSMTAVVGRLAQRVGNSLRWVDQVDETRAGRVRVQIEDRFDLKSRHASLRADGQVKIDGEKIDLG